MATLTKNEYAALKAIVEVGEAVAGDRCEGWWSVEILMYAKECPLTGKSFSGACGSLAKKKLVGTHEYEKNEFAIFPTSAGLAAFDAYVEA